MCNGQLVSESNDQSLFIEPRVVVILYIIGDTNGCPISPVVVGRFNGSLSKSTWSISIRPISYWVGSTGAISPCMMLSTNAAKVYRKMKKLISSKINYMQIFPCKWKRFLRFKIMETYSEYKYLWWEKMFISYKII